MCAMKKSDFKMQLRKEAKRVIGGAKFAGTGHGAYREQVEAGRKHYLQKSNEGGDWTAQRVKGEITYLLNNYLVANVSPVQSSAASPIVPMPGMGMPGSKPDISDMTTLH